jgi:hypothetical protein
MDALQHTPALARCRAWVRPQQPCGALASWYWPGSTLWWCEAHAALVTQPLLAAYDRAALERQLLRVQAMSEAEHRPVDWLEQQRTLRAQIAALKALEPSHEGTEEHS